MRYTKGSNQYVKKAKHNALAYVWYYLFSVGFLIALSLLVMQLPTPTVDQADARTIVSPVASPLPMISVKPTITPSPTIVPSVKDQAITVIKKTWRRDWKIGVAIASCESGLRPNAINDRNTNGSTDAGLFQVNTIHQWEVKEMLDPVKNALFAYVLYQEQGLQPWSASKHCWEAKL